MNYLWDAPLTWLTQEFHNIHPELWPLGVFCGIAFFVIHEIETLKMVREGELEDFTEFLAENASNLVVSGWIAIISWIATIWLVGTLALLATLGFIILVIAAAAALLIGAKYLLWTAAKEGWL